MKLFSIGKCHNHLPSTQSGGLGVVNAVAVGRRLALAKSGCHQNVMPTTCRKLDGRLTVDL